MFFTLLTCCIVAVEPTPPISVEDGLVLMQDVTFASPSEDNSLEAPLRMEVAFPTVSLEPLPVVLYVHGGAWMGGSRQDGNDAIKLIALGGYFAASIDYRLTDQAGFPAAVHDCKAAIRFIRKHSTELHVDPTRIGIVGFSAGGHLAVLTAFSEGIELLDGSLNGSEVSTAVNCVVSVSGALMPHLAKGEGGSIYEQWALSDSTVAKLDTVPHTYLDKDDPPAYFLCGKDDRLCPPKDTKTFSRLVAKAGVEQHYDLVRGSGHVISKPKDYLGMMAFLDSKLGGSAELGLRTWMKSNGRDK